MKLNRDNLNRKKTTHTKNKDSRNNNNDNDLKKITIIKENLLNCESACEFFVSFSKIKIHPI